MLHYITLPWRRASCPCRAVREAAGGGTARGCAWCWPSRSQRGEAAPRAAAVRRRREGATGHDRQPHHPGGRPKTTTPTPSDREENAGAVPQHRVQRISLSNAPAARPRRARRSRPSSTCRERAARSGPVRAVRRASTCARSRARARASLSAPRARRRGVAASPHTPGRRGGGVRGAMTRPAEHNTRGGKGRHRVGGEG